ncbi:MAG: NUDIX domain-containing protein [Actinomycetes bacterium]
MAGFRHLRDDLVHEGWVIRLCTSTFEAPDGTEFQRDVVRHPGAVSVVPLRDDGSVVLVRQYRAAVDALVLEIPAGKRDVAGEAPEVTAGRELAEEVGLAAGRLELLSTFHNSIGFSDELSYVFLAQDLTPVPTDRQGVEEAFLEVLEVPLETAVAMVGNGEITDAKTVIGLLTAHARAGG